MSKDEYADRIALLEDKIVHADFNELHVLQLRHMRHDGTWSADISREVLERANSVAVLPYDPKTDSVVLVEQFRPGTWMAGRNPWQLEPPAGMMEESESIEDVGRRETREEARCEVSELEPVYDFLVSAGCSTEIVYTFCGRTNTNALETFGGNTEEDEDTRIHVIEFADAMRDLAAGRFEYSLTIICLQWLSMHRERLREMWR